MLLKYRKPKFINWVHSVTDILYGGLDVRVYISEELVIYPPRPQPPTVGTDTVNTVCCGKGSDSVTSYSTSRGGI